MKLLFLKDHDTTKAGEVVEYSVYLTDQIERLIKDGKATPAETQEPIRTAVIKAGRKAVIRNG